MQLKDGGQYPAFPSQQAESPEEYLQAALLGESYVRSHLRDTADGLYFSQDGVPNDTLYSGGAGILHMYMQLYQIHPDPVYRQIIRSLTVHLSAHYPDTLTRAEQAGDLARTQARAFYTGIAGIGAVLLETLHLFREPSAEHAVREITQFCRESAVRTADGIYWTDNSVIYADAGVILFLADVWEMFPDPGLQELIQSAAGYILRKAIPHPEGGMEFDNLQIDFKHKEPNFEFGTAGVGYLFAVLFRIFGNETYLDAAEACAVYVRGLGVKQEKGVLIPYKLTWTQDLFYLGNCHGPVGTIKLFYELYRITGKQVYYDMIQELHSGAASLGAPLIQSPGFWNTTCLCCGPAGYIPLYIGLYRLDGQTTWRERAQATGDVLLGTRTLSEDGHACFWRLAFDRTSPEKISAPAGYFNGTAGIAAQLANLCAFLKGAEGYPSLIDDPYGTTSVIFAPADPEDPILPAWR